jgi:hypothetical protein
MTDFSFYFSLGWQHIISLEATDHILFIIVLSAIYLVGNWKQVLVLVTAFTIGHSLTLALSVYDIIKINSDWVEFLIPVTILATAVFNLFQKQFNRQSLRLNYFLALFFGLIHGLGFANTIKFMLAKSQGIGLPLFSFNVGLEAGQLVIVTLILSCSFFLVNIAGLQRKWWVWILSIIAFCASLFLVITRWPV